MNQPAPYPVALLPQPGQMELSDDGVCNLHADTQIVAAPGTLPEARLLAELLAPVFGRQPLVSESDDVTSPCIRLVRLDDALADEAYRLDIDAGGVRLGAATGAGLARAAATLIQLLPPQAPAGCGVSFLRITDQPRYAWRGFMLDPARRFIPVAEVMRWIDLLAAHRMNRLHLHLTDDQGWRLEIRRYPRLTAVGAWRCETQGDGVPHGGFYTQADIRRIVAHANSRYVTVVPEIDLPGHLGAAIAAYPWLGSEQAPRAVPTVWGVNPHILQPDERGLRLLEDVLAEVLELFPSPWIHIGGDEAVKDEWLASAAIQARITELGCGDATGLQARIIARMGAFLGQRGRILIGWDEIVEGGLPPRAVVMSWRGTQGGMTAIAAGHEVVMTPTSHTYFDYGHATTPLARVYAFDPTPKELPVASHGLVLGGQGQLWGEYITDATARDGQAFPRLCALAEVLWTPRAQCDWTDFRRRLVLHQRRLAACGVAMGDGWPTDAP